MLSRIAISNIALIEKLELDFSSGFNVFTGETGAGKSIIIDSVNLVLGERADRDLIKSGCDKAYVEALFTITDQVVLQQIQQLGVETDCEVILSRELGASGKNVCKINGRLTSLNIVKMVSDLLIDVHGQHEHQSLLNAEVQKKYIDEFGGDPLKELLAKYRDLYDQWREIIAFIEKDKISPEELERKSDILEFQRQEIFAANLTVGEDEQLAQERDMLKNTEKIRTALQTSYQCVYSGEHSALTNVKQTLDCIGHISGFSSEFESLNNAVNEIYYSLEDLSIELRSIKDSFDGNPQRMEEVTDRLELIKKLKRKYGATIEDILAFYDDVNTELSEIEQHKAQGKTAFAEKLRLENTLFIAAMDLSQMRRTAAQRFEKQLLNELQGLNLEKCRFNIKFDELAQDVQHCHFSQDGLDNIEMLISTNPGEPLKPLSKIASGGEISRIMLGIKAVVSQTDSISCLIFDEIDSGISGKTASVVGDKMLNISKARQIICITHSPQIAALADTHFLIEKKEDNSKYVTSAHILDDNEKIYEIARILGNDKISETALQHAKQLICAKHN